MEAKDIDGLEWIAAPGDEDYAVIHEDAGNIHGERKFLAKLGKPGSGTDIKYYFAAMSGGKANSRLLAGVGAVAGSVNKPNAHEFSGAFDLHKGEDGAFSLAYPMPPGKKRELDLATPVNEKKMIISLQATAISLGRQSTSTRTGSARCSCGSPASREAIEGPMRDGGVFRSYPDQWR